MVKVSTVEIKEKTSNMNFNKRSEFFMGYLNELFDKLGIPDLGSEVILKPNICVGKQYTTGAITDPALVNAIAHFIEKEEGVKPVVADGPVVGKEGKKVFSQSGYSELKGNGIELIDLHEDDFMTLEVSEEIRKKINKLEFLTQDCKYEAIEISKKAKNADSIISIPSMKTHVLTTVTLSLKNMKGILSEREKKNFHMKGLAQGIVTLNHLLPPTLSIVDGVIAQEGLGPMNGTPRHAGLLIASNNPVATDIVTSELMGIPPDDSGVTRAAKEVFGIPNIDLLGNPQCKEFERAGEIKEYEGVNIISEEACSGCTSALYSTLSRLEGERELEELISVYGDISLSKGFGASAGKEGYNIAIGNCTDHIKEDVDLYIPGCPPIEMLAEDSIRVKALEKDPENSTEEEIDEFLSQED